MTPAIDFTGRKALVTGGASGIGEACAVALAQEGRHVVVVDIDLPRAEAALQRAMFRQRLVKKYRA